MDIEITSKALSSFLQEEFKSLASDQGQLYQRSFQLYCDYPLLVSQRLFEIFDIESKNYLTQKDYIYGFNNLFLGNTHIKVNMLFNFFDYNKKGLIHTEDIQMIINYLFSYCDNNNEYNKQWENEFKTLKDYSNSQAMTIQQLVYYLQMIDSSVFVIFYSFIYSKRSFNQEVVNAIGKKDFTKGQFESFYFQQLICDSIINLHIDDKTIVFILRTCDVCIGQYTGDNRNKSRDNNSNEDNNEDEDNHDNEEKEMNDLMSFEDDLINIKEHLIPIRTHSAHTTLYSNFVLDTNNVKNASIDLESMTKKNTQTSLPSVSFGRKSTGMTVNEEAFNAFLPKRNNKKITMKIIDRFIIVYRFSKEEDRIYERLIPIKCLYIPNPSSNKSNDLTVQMASLFTNQNENDLTVTFFNQNDKVVFISLINFITNNRNIFEYYFISNDVSHGKMGDVQIGINTINQSKVIIKTLHKHTFINYYWEVEINKFIMRNPNENVIKCYDIFDYYDQVIIIQEYIEYGSLLDLISTNKINLSSALIFDIVAQMVNGLEYLHNNGIIHRDIKPNNILVKAENNNRYTIKYIDFGVSQMIFSKQTQTDCVGTFLFVAPEMFVKLPYSFSVDIWSLGIVIFYLQFGFLPFSMNVSDSNNEIVTSLLTKNLIIPNHSSYSTDTAIEQNTYSKINRIIKKTLDKDPSKRSKCPFIKLELCINNI